MMRCMAAAGDGDGDGEDHDDQGGSSTVTGNSSWSWNVVGSNRRIASVDATVEETTTTTTTSTVVLHEQEEKGGWGEFLGYVGPGFLVSLAYLDPANLETDLQAGSNHKYELLWVILIGLIFALIIQSLAANLGVVTGKHLAEHCRAEYPKYVSYCLWILTEVALVATDIPEVLGTAFALNILFRIPIWGGTLVTVLSTLLLLGLESFGVRKLEMLIVSLVFVMGVCFFVEVAYIKPDANEVIQGLFIPRLNGYGAIGDAIALIGALIMPHNLFLHSALVLSRKTRKSARGIKHACRYFLIEAGFAMSIALLINIAIISVTGKICSGDNLTDSDLENCTDLHLNSASFLLKHVSGNASSVLYAVALLASGQSSAISATYAGQFIMQGFLNLQMKGWQRNLLTRSLAIVPSAIVSVIGGQSAAGKLIIIAAIILAFEIPFALIPLLKFSSSETKLENYKNSTFIITLSWLLGLLIIGINLYYLSTGFIDWLKSNGFPSVGTVLLAIVVFSLTVAYVVAVVYLTFKEETHVDVTRRQPADDQQRLGNISVARTANLIVTD